MKQYLDLLQHVLDNGTIKHSWELGLGGNNLTNALALATCYTQIKANASNSSYRNAFATGLVMSSAGLITNQNSNAFINALLMCSGLANVSSSNSTQQNQQATTTATTTLFQAVNKK